MITELFVKGCLGYERDEESIPEQPEPAAFEALSETYAVRKGDCFNVAEALSDLCGGEVVFVTQNGHPLHAFVRLPNGKHCDGAGMARPEQICAAFDDGPDSCSIRPTMEGDQTDVHPELVDDIKALIRQNDPRL